LPPHFIFYGGKGGVGKTTCAAARAVASAGRGTRVLVVSTDPAHSLGDALGVRLSSRVAEVRVGRHAIHAVELDAPHALARWLADHRVALGDVLEHGTWLDRHDVDALLDLPIPGVDELVGMVEVVRLAAAGPRRTPPLGQQTQGTRTTQAARPAPQRGPASGRAFDTVVIDTAPTGHTLRLLAAPETVASVAGVLDALQAEHRLIRQQFARAGRPEAADRLITLIAEQASDTGELLRDPARTAFEWVMLPEALSLAESADALRTLDRAGIPVPRIIVNHVLPGGPACPVCDRRRYDERRVIAQIPRVLGRTRQVRIVPAEIHEPRGVPALARIGQAITPRSGAGPPAGRPVTAGRRFPAAPAAASVSTRSPHQAPESMPAFRDARLLFFGGKGGVGKTTAAAATAVRLATARPATPVLLLSTDPAHSLADVFGVAIGDRATSIPGGPRNLRVRELDAPAALAARRAGLEAALAEIASAFGGAGRGGRPGSTVTNGTGHDSAERAVARLMDLAPPGIDELLGMLTVVDAQHDYPLIVVDTAPTGHALRLLEMPDAAREWVQVLMRVLLKYRSVVRPGRLAAELVDLSKSIRELQGLVRNHGATRFIVVTRAAEVPRLETERLLDRLRRLGLATPAVVINALTLAPRRCPRCRATAAGERRVLAALERRCRRGRRECAIIQTPLTAPPPRRVAALDRWARMWTLER
jgi:arsenite/tail-anchored protein-transporting ATPase